MEAPTDDDSVGFGPFVVDLRRRVLRKHGRRIRLSGQPFEVLVALLEARGETVTRESLRDRLWPGVPFGDFDHRLTVAVKKLRDQLGDDAVAPRYISTIDRQGYRFAGTVAVVPSSNKGRERPAVAAPPVPVFPPDPTAAVVPTASGTAWGPAWRRVGILGLFATLIATMLIASGLTIAWMSSREPTPSVERVAQLTHSGGVHPTQRLLTDGPRLYFAERSAGIIESKWLLPAGGPSVRLALPFDSFDLQDISPDGSDLLVRDLTGFPRGPNRLWLAPVGGGPPRRIGEVSANTAAFTSDGRAVLFGTRNEVFVSDRDGSHRRKLLTVSGTVESIHVSPVGDRISLAITDGVARIRLWEAEIDGSGLRPLLDEEEVRPDWGGSWSADGRWFTFSARDTSGDNIWLFDHRSHTLQRLTSGPLAYRLPIFSHDGRRIFCVGVTRRVELLRYHITTRQFVPMLAGASAEHVRYSPQGLEIAYITYPEGVLWRSRPDGGDGVQLTPTSWRALDPNWSPDGSRVLFKAQEVRGGPWGVYVVAASGGSPERVWDDTHQKGMAWSRDGRSIIVARADPSAPLTQLNLDNRTASDLPGTEGLQYPVRSPSGRYLLATDSQAWTLQALDLDAHTQKSLGHAGQYASWSSDDQFVYFNRFDSAYKAAMYRIRVADGDVAELFTLDEFNPGGSWGTWSGVTPDGDVLLTRDLGGVDLYSINLSERTVARSRVPLAKVYP
jgi:DNA-binding winged helix-turn-helix (wHTH) protein/Tol biopolymer transport system component